MAADAARAAAHTPAVTADGETIEVSANVGTHEEVAPAVAAGADGVGLFRTEFLFMDRDAMPTEDEQEAAYRLAAEALNGRPLLLRTLDAGADTNPPYLDSRRAEPVLGVRGVRLGLARPDLLPPADARRRGWRPTSSVRVMFPMVGHGRRTPPRSRTAGGGSDGRWATARSSRPASWWRCGRRRSRARVLATSVDFFSIGTNDLTQYVLAARSRKHEHVASLSDAVHPASPSTHRGTTIAERCRSLVGVCGELAGDASATSLLLGLGVPELSERSGDRAGQARSCAAPTSRGRGPGREGAGMRVRLRGPGLLAV